VRLDVTAAPGSTRIELASTAEPVDVGGGVASALQLTDLRASSTARVNVASTQQFFAASPVPSR
jgi:phosphoribosylformimino-5-aminoimidazole carboxamide ribonucleotide (ProFAR) isomerase